MSNKRINTVLGTITAEEVGRCLVHQHVIYGYPGFECAEAMPLNHEEFLEKAIPVFEDARDRCGLKTVIDATPGDCGRDAVLLKKLSDRTGVNIIASTGYYYENEGAPVYFKFRMAYGNAEKEIYNMMHKEVCKGIGNTDIKAGVIKVGTSDGVITDYEDLFLRAAARVSAEEDVNIITHTQGGTMGSEQARRLLEYGAKPTRIQIGHLDNCTDIDELMKIYEQGVYGAFDRLGIQGFTGALPENRRIAMIAALAMSGYADKITLAHDSIITMLGDPWVYSEQDAKDLEKWNWTHVFDDIIPTLIKMGIDKETAWNFTDKNPAEMLG